jgi:hypothetical protein
MVLTDRSLGTELQKGTRQIKESIAEKTKEGGGEGGGCRDNFHAAWMNNWWIMNSHIDG